MDRYAQGLHLNRLLIKDIFAHLLLGWTDHHFPEVRKVLIVRHPCAVALSKERLRHWRWFDRPQDFLSQRDLYDDFLRGYEDVILGTESYFERQIVIWAVIHYVALRQLIRNRIHWVFYEELRANPEAITRNLLSYLGHAEDLAEFEREICVQHSRMSQTSETGDSSSRRDAGNRWAEQVTSHQLDRANQILSAFELDRLYGTDATPDRAAAEALLGSNLAAGESAAARQEAAPRQP